MQRISTLIWLWVLVSVIQYSRGANIFPTTEWETGTIDLRDNGCERVFYYLFKATNKSSKSDLTIWIADGPGSAAAISFFLELGPYIFDSNLNYIRNEYAWTNVSDLLFVDFPLGVGLSPRQTCSESAVHMKDLSYQLSVFVSKFVFLHPEYASTSLSYACEGYGCQLLVNYGAHLQDVSENIGRMKSLFLRNPMIDYATELAWTKYVRYHNLLNFFQTLLYAVPQAICTVAIQLEIKETIRSFCDPTMEAIAEAAHISHLDNIHRQEGYEKEYSQVIDWMTNKTIQNSFGLSDLQPFVLFNSTLYYVLNPQLKFSAKAALETLLQSHIPVTIVYGEANYVYNWIGGVQLADSLQWPFQEAFKKLPMTQDECGFYKRAETLTFRVINKAGMKIGRENPACLFKVYSESMAT